MEFRETSQNFNSIRQPIEKMKIKIAETLRGFTKFYFKVSAFYLQKQKSFIPKKKFLGHSL